MPFILFLLLLLTFPYWFPLIAIPAILIGVVWMIGYPIACTGHWIFMRLVFKKKVPWNLLYPHKENKDD